MIVYTILAVIVIAIFRVMHLVKIVGRENVPTDRGYMICANHSSLSDPIYVVTAVGIRPKVRFMAKKEIFKNKLLNSLFRYLGGFPVDRGGADVMAIKEALKTVRSGGRLAIFPQGTRQPRVNPRDTEVKTGISLIASRSGADVLPVCIKTRGDKTGFFKKTYVIIGKPIKNSELDLEHEKGSEGFSHVAQKIFDKVCDLYDATDIKNEKK